MYNLSIVGSVPIEELPHTIYSNPCALCIARTSSFEFIFENPHGCIVIPAVPELMLRKTLE